MFVVVLSNLIELSGMPPPIAQDHVPKLRTTIRTSCQVVPAMFVARRRRRPSVQAVHAAAVHQAVDHRRREGRGRERAGAGDGGADRRRGALAPVRERPAVAAAADEHPAAAVGRHVAVVLVGLDQLRRPQPVEAVGARGVVLLDRPARRRRGRLGEPVARARRPRDAGVFAVATTPLMAASPSMLVMASAMVALRPTRRSAAAVPRRPITISSALIPDRRVGAAPSGFASKSTGRWSVRSTPHRSPCAA